MVLLIMIGRQYDTWKFDCEITNDTLKDAHAICTRVCVETTLYTERERENAKGSVYLWKAVSYYRLISNDIKMNIFLS